MHMSNIQYLSWELTVMYLNRHGVQEMKDK